MNREQLECIGIKDRTGTEIRNGDVFEYENTYVIRKDAETREFNIYEYENQVEYGVDEEPYFILVGIYSIKDDEIDLTQDQIKGNIFIDYKEMLNQIHEEEDE